MEDFEVELKLDFLNESVDLLDSAESAFFRLETEREDSDLLNEIFRLAHNLKGTSKAVGFDQLAELTHVAENLILKLKDGTLRVSDSIVSTLLEFKDKVNEMVNGLKQSLDATFEIEDLKIKIENEASGLQSEFQEQVAKQEVDLNLSVISEDLVAEKIKSVEISPEFNDSRFEDFDCKESLVEGSDLSSKSVISQAAIESLRESGFDDDVIYQMLSEDERLATNENKKECEDTLFENIDSILTIKKSKNDDKWKTYK